MAGTGKNISQLRTVGVFASGRSCADTLFHMIAGGYALPMVPEERAAMPLAGGIVQHGYQCGAIWGGALAAGAEAYRRHGAGRAAETRAIAAGKALLEAFRRQNPSADCVDLTDIDQSSSVLKMVTYFVAKGGTFRCFRRVARYAPVAFDAVEAALATPLVEPAEGPVSCAAELARRRGASDQHATMAAGLAGGIGLSGGACGALGAAIWLTGLASLADGAARLDWKSRTTLAVVERFMRATDYEFECAQIVGRRFDGVTDHAAHLRAGGCERVLAALATA